MKHKFLFLLVFPCLLLSACFETEETYNLNANGSYSLNYDLNMGGMVGLMSGMLPDSIKESKDFTAIKDTVIQLSSMPDSLRKNMTEAELSIVDHTNMRFQLDFGKALFKIGFKNEGGSINGLANFLNNFSSAMHKAKLGNTLNNTMEGKNIPAASDSEEELPFANKEFDYVITSSTFERKIRPVVFAAKKEKDEKAYQLLKTMNMKLTSTVVINLPKPAVSIDNPNAVLSADKKQFKLTIDLMEALEKPSILNFKVTY
jgi:hypothetical protein